MQGYRGSFIGRFRKDRCISNIPTVWSSRSLRMQATLSSPAMSVRAWQIPTCLLRPACELRRSSSTRGQVRTTSCSPLDIHIITWTCCRRLVLGERCSRHAGGERGQSLLVRLCRARRRKKSHDMFNYISTGTSCVVEPGSIDLASYSHG